MQPLMPVVFECVIFGILLLLSIVGIAFISSLDAYFNSLRTLNELRASKLRNELREVDLLKHEERLR